MLFLYALDRTDLSIYATFGAFAAVYGRHNGYVERFAMQAGAGITIVLAMLIGTTSMILNVPEVVRVLVVAAVAAIVTVLADVFAWKPSGAIFAVFAAGACASIPGDLSSLIDIVLVGGGTVAFALLVTVAITRARVSIPELFAPVPRSAVHPGSVQEAALVCLATALSGWAGFFLLGDHWYWAMVAAIAAMTGADLHARVVRGFQRFIGTLLGVIIAAGFLWIDPPVIITLMLAIAFQGIIELIVARNYGLAMLFITTVALLMVTMASPQSVETIIRNRVLETTLGVAIGMAISVIAARFEPTPSAARLH